MKTLKYASSCYVNLIYNLVLTLYKNSPFIKNKLFIKILQYYVKTCFQRCFEFFTKKINLWRKVWNSQKTKSVKNIIIEKSATKIFQVWIIIVYDSFILELSISISIGTAVLFWRKHKIRTSFKTLASKKTTIWRLKKSHSNDNRLEKIMSSSYHMEQKTFIKESCIYNIHTEKKIFCSCCFWRFVNRLDSDRLKNLKCTWVCTSLLLLL